MKTVFIDSGVLIAAVRGAPEVTARAIEILENPDISFASSEYVRLEVLPKAIFFGHERERFFYEEFFENARHWAPLEETLVRDALRVGILAGLSALDALHVAAALAVGADELITTERPGKPIHRVREITVRTIHEPRS